MFQYALFYWITYSIFGFYKTQHVVRLRWFEILSGYMQVLFLQVFFTVPDDGF